MEFLRRRKKVPRVTGGIGTQINYNGRLYRLITIAVHEDEEVRLSFTDENSLSRKHMITGRDL